MWTKELPANKPLQKGQLLVQKIRLHRAHSLIFFLYKIYERNHYWFFRRKSVPNRRIDGVFLLNIQISLTFNSKMKQHSCQDDIGTFTKLDKDWSRQSTNKHLGSLIFSAVAICRSRFVTYELFTNDAQWRKQIWTASLDRVFRLMETDARRIWREQVQSGAQRHFWRDCRAFNMQSNSP